MNLQVEIEKEEDNRWIAEIPMLPGVLAYGNTRQEAILGSTPIRSYASTATTY